jgi:hypothetical protein
LSFHRIVKIKSGHPVLAILVIAGAAARAQVAPATTGFPGLPVSGALNYNLSYTQIAEFYRGAQGGTQYAIASGEAAYANSRSARPFTLTYSGGYMWDISGPSTETGFFQHLLVSQGFVRHHWALNLSDDVSYLPYAPTTGFSGIPGVGTLPSAPGVPSQPVLTVNTPSIYNTVNATITRTLDRATKISAGGAYTILRFPDGSGLEENMYQINSQVTQRLNARNSIFGQYAFSHFTYPGYTITMGTQSALLGFNRVWNPRLTTSVSAGPEWVRSSDSALIPSSLEPMVSAKASYHTRSTSLTLTYFQGEMGGTGISTEFGTSYKDLSATLARSFGRQWSLSATGSYIRTVGLQSAGVTNGFNGTIDAEEAEAAATRQLGRHFSAFANYTAIRQSSSSALPSNAVSGLMQIIGFGIRYSSQGKRLEK